MKWRSNPGFLTGNALSDPIHNDRGQYERQLQNQFSIFHQSGFTPEESNLFEGPGTLVAAPRSREYSRPQVERHSP